MIHYILFNAMSLQDVDDSGSLQLPVLRNFYQCLGFFGFFTISPNLYSATYLRKFVR